MRRSLTSDHVKAALWTLHHQLEQGKYPHDQERLLTALRALSEGRFEVISGRFPSTTFAADLLPAGSAVEKDVYWSSFDIESLKPCTFLRHQERSISGDEMCRRAVRDHCNLGLLDLKRMLTEQEKISTKFRDFEILFPGTLIREKDRVLKIPCLKFFPKHWDQTQGEFRKDRWDIRWIPKNQEWGIIQRFAGRGE